MTHDCDAGKLRHTVYAAYRRMGIPLGYVDQDFLANLQQLKAALLNGSARAVGVTARRSNCRIARDLIDGKEYAIAVLLAAYGAPEGEIPILPHPRCDRLNQEVVERCCCCWRLLPKEIPGVDPEFKAWLDEEIRKALTSGT